MKTKVSTFWPITVYNIITTSQWSTVDGYQIIAYFLSPRYVLKSKPVAETRPLSEVNVIGPGSSPPRSRDYSGFWVLWDESVHVKMGMFNDHTPYIHLHTPCMDVGFCQAWCLRKHRWELSYVPWGAGIGF